MASRIRVGIAGTGSYVPERAVPNAYFEGFLDTSDEWIVQRTGIRERRFAAEDEATSDLCVHAANRALEDAGIGPEDLDLIVVGTLTPDYPLPSAACLIQDRIGAKRAGAFDVAAACTGFMTSLSTGEAFVAAGRARRVLVLGAETLSRFVDFEDRGSAIIFGDGAGAAVLTPHDECGQGEILRTTLGADGSGYDYIHISAGGSRHPPTAQTVEERKHFIQMRGREVFRFAVSHMSEMISEMLDGYDQEELTLVVPHQVNRRIIDAALDRLGMTDEKVMVNIHKYGNTSAATVPVALDEAHREGRIEKGKLVVMVAFGAGLTWGGALVRW
ncbi:MAG TPA: ketoacyl-ACP synthase III [Planctomycetes bacterium]|nr:ketoacyl-ACP synthase III [Planctomycetota bacterium]